MAKFADMGSGPQSTKQSTASSRKGIPTSAKPGSSVTRTKGSQASFKDGKKSVSKNG